MTADKVLLIEDDERIGSSLVRALQGNGFEVHWTRSGEDGIASGGVRRPDLVLLDLGLPDLDGLDVCRRLHSLDPTIDIIMLTARDEELDVVVGLDAGAVDYISAERDRHRERQRCSGSDRHREEGCWRPGGGRLTWRR
jgi:DNA-binding response OmpR family regulator